MASKPSTHPGPPLPPRQSDSWMETPPPSYQNTSHDPRKSSNDSLLPHWPGRSDLRKLLLVYVHGFMGDEASFRSFPAHVHNVLTVLLADTHSVHSKVYPRFRSKRNISVARDNFSVWLEPHESPTTDVVLLGHSMGGLISAEVALMPAPVPAARAFKHRILGTINFDVPFLGMHPGVVRSGLASIFKPADDTQGDKYAMPAYLPANADGHASPGASQTSLPSSPGSVRPPDGFWEPEQRDPNFNPKFQNDVVLPVRKGWRNVQHFIKKHSDNLTGATKQLVNSHVEFMSAMANHNELRARYARLRALEVDNEALRRSIAKTDVQPPRVRFVNYYTASTGRPKPVKPAETNSLPSGVGSGASLEIVPHEGVERSSEMPSSIASLSLERSVDGAEGEKREGDVVDSAIVEIEIGVQQEDTNVDSKSKLGSHEEHPEPKKEAIPEGSERSLELENALIPSNTDKTANSEVASTAASESKDKAPPKDRKFCLLPPKDSNGERDPAWVRVYMKDVDEVGAHCGLFFVDERYERLVGDVADRIEDWVKDDMSARFAKESGSS